jgi:hypothetical protein
VTIATRRVRFLGFLCWAFRKTENDPKLFTDGRVRKVWIVEHPTQSWTNHPRIYSEGKTERDGSAVKRLNLFSDDG